MADAFIRVTTVGNVVRAFRRVRNKVSTGGQTELVAFARPVAEDAQRRATLEISGMKRERQAPPWSTMRVGVLTDAVYIAPVRRGRRSRRNQAIRRPNLKVELLQQAMEPAARANEPKLVERYEQLLDQAAREFGRGA